MSYINYKGSQKTLVELGGLQVPTVIAPKDVKAKCPIRGAISYFLKGSFSLLKGMKITLSYLVRPSTVVTQQYPENRKTLKMFDRYRGELRLTYDDKEVMHCTGCQFCEIVCPNKSIIISTRKNEVHGKDELNQFIWRWDSCTFCNACVQVCPHEAIEFKQSFESATMDRRLFVYNLNQSTGPHSKVFKRAEKKGEDIEALKATTKKVQRYDQDSPLGGKDLPGVPTRLYKGEGLE